MKPASTGRRVDARGALGCYCEQWYKHSTVRGQPLPSGCFVFERWAATRNSPQKTSNNRNNLRKTSTPLKILNNSPRQPSTTTLNNPQQPTSKATNGWQTHGPACTVKACSPFESLSCISWGVPPFKLDYRVVCTAYSREGRSPRTAPKRSPAVVEVEVSTIRKVATMHTTFGLH